MPRMNVESARKWMRRFLDLADKVSEWSHDPSTKVGCVIATHDNRILSLGFNGFPRGVDDDIRRYENKQLKYKLVCHAERNALDNAHFDVTAATLYTTLFTCNECAKSVIQRGIKKVVAYDPGDDPREDLFGWQEAKQMYKEAGVKVLFIPPPTQELSE